MIRARTIGLLIGAVGCLLAAGALVVSAGLPERADYSGVIADNGSVIAPEIDAFAPPFEKPGLNGATISLYMLRGHPVVINFWATWCEPCRVEMPELEAFYEANRASGLRLLAVNLGETPDVARAWTQQLGLTFDIVLDPDQSVAALYRLRGQPSTYVVSPGGVISQIFYGPTTHDALQAAVAPYLGS